MAYGVEQKCKEMKKEVKWITRHTIGIAEAERWGLLPSVPKLHGDYVYDIKETVYTTTPFEDNVLSLIPDPRLRASYLDWLRKKADENE